MAALGPLFLGACIAMAALWEGEGWFALPHPRLSCRKIGVEYALRTAPSYNGEIRLAGTSGNSKIDDTGLCGKIDDLFGEFVVE